MISAALLILLIGWTAAIVVWFDSREAHPLALVGLSVATGSLALWLLIGCG